MDGRVRLGDWLFPALESEHINEQSPELAELVFVEIVSYGLVIVGPYT